MNYLEHIRDTGKQEEYIAHHYAMGETVADIAEKFQVSRQAVYDNLARYRKKLKLKGEEVRFYRGKKDE